MRIPAKTAKRLTLAAVSMLGSLPGGGKIIDLMGHMRPAAELKFAAHNIDFPSRVGLGSGISSDAASLNAFGRFGFGFLEIGPVTVEPIEETKLERDFEKEAISRDDRPANSGLDSFVKNELPSSKTAIPLLIRIAHPTGSSCEKACIELERFRTALPEWTHALVIDTRFALPEWSEAETKNYFQNVSQLNMPIILAIAPDSNAEFVQQLITAVAEFKFMGISISGGIRDSSTGLRIFGRSTFDSTLAMLRTLRNSLPETLIIAGDGVIEPVDALKLLDTGTDLISIYSGIVFSGPGLAKRINESYSNALAQRRQTPSEIDRSPYSIRSVLNSGWLGFALVGFGLMITGASAITVALTTVILPYDEKFLGLTRDTLAHLNPQLLPFLSHDRVTYAGAGTSCGLLFLALSYFGSRRGMDWAFKAARLSCAFGFISFLLFLGFRYLDPLHAFVTLLLVPFFVWGCVKPPQAKPMCSSNLHNSAAWKKSLIGQCLFVGIGAGLILAGLTICKVGTSTVFVNEDLMFMNTTAETLLCHNDHLLPAIAHDRAGFGGTLVTAGISVLLTALHGFRQGEGWIWWMLLIAGLPGFVSTLGIHFAIGYTSFIHLLPAYIAFIMFSCGLVLSYSYLCTEPGADTSSNPPFSTL